MIESQSLISTLKLCVNGRNTEAAWASVYPVPKFFPRADKSRPDLGPDGGWGTSGTSALGLPMFPTPPPSCIFPKPQQLGRARMDMCPRCAPLGWWAAEARRRGQEVVLGRE